MKIKCKNCGNVIDLRTRTIIEYYLKGGAIKCIKCLNDNRIDRGDKNEGE